MKADPTEARSRSESEVLLESDPFYPPRGLDPHTCLNSSIGILMSVSNVKAHSFNCNNRDKKARYLAEIDCDSSSDIYHVYGEQKRRPTMRTYI